VRSPIKNLAPLKLLAACGIAVLFLCNLETFNFIMVSDVLYATITDVSSPYQLTSG
jgi:hypothetical protein